MSEGVGGVQLPIDEVTMAQIDAVAQRLAVAGDPPGYWSLRYALETLAATPRTCAEVQALADALAAAVRDDPSRVCGQAPRRTVRLTPPWRPPRQWVPRFFRATRK